MQAPAPSVVNSLITGTFGLAAALVGFISASHLQGRTSKAAAREQLRAVANELFAAVFDLQVALSAYDARWSSWRARGSGVGLALLEFMAAKAEGNWGQGTLRASRTAIDWGHRVADAETAVLSGPLSRVGAALGRIQLLPEPAVVSAAHDLGDAIFAVTASYGSPNIYRRRGRAIERREASEQLASALGNLNAIVRQRLDPPSWWRSMVLMIGGLVRRRKRAEVPAGACSRGDPVAVQQRSTATAPTIVDRNHSQDAAPYRLAPSPTALPVLRRFMVDLAVPDAGVNTGQHRYLRRPEVRDPCISVSEDRYPACRSTRYPS